MTVGQRFKCWHTPAKRRSLSLVRVAVTSTGHCCTVRPVRPDLLLQGTLDVVINKKAFPTRVKQRGII